MWEIKVTDFGPVREGSVTLRPLTIFIGANNTGKSYMAQAVYALESILRTTWWDPRGLPQREERFFKKPSKRPSSGNRASDLELEETFLKELSKRAVSELQRCFGSTIQELARDKTGSLSIALSQAEPPRVRSCRRTALR